MIITKPPSTLLVFEHYRSYWIGLLPEADRERLQEHEDRLTRAGLGGAL